MKNTTSWILWFAVSLIILLSTRNPIYIIMVLVGCFILGFNLLQKDESSFWFKQNFRFLLTMIFISTFINGLFTHIGSTRIFTIPAHWPLIGGEITLESIAYGAINGLIISAIYLLFNVLNLALSIKQLINLIPRAFYPIAIMTSIALTFFPSIQKRAKEIKEAQMIRGNAMKKVTDWLPILMPLLITSLENAFLLSESMMARGFHTQTNEKETRFPLLMLVLGIFSIFSGLLLNLYNYSSAIFISLYIFGFVIICASIWITNRSAQVTKFYRETWKRNDIIASAIFITALVIFITMRITGNLPTLSYTPYPTLSLPDFQFAPLILCSLTTLPIAWISHD